MTPSLRSVARGAVLAETMLDPTLELSISEVGRRAGLLPAVAGTPSRTDLLDVAEGARDRLHVEVNIHTTTQEAWAAKVDPFLATVAARPMVVLTGGEAADDRAAQSENADG